jgi:hypothetical protein
MENFDFVRFLFISIGAAFAYKLLLFTRKENTPARQNKLALACGALTFCVMVVLSWLFEI